MTKGEPTNLAVPCLSHVGEIRYACSKDEAGRAVGFPDKTASYFPDREKAPENRQVPFIHDPVDIRLAPFKAWAEQNGQV